MTDATRSRLAVLGSPIEHSKSPLLHAAAYRVLGLDWRYGSAEVTGAILPAFVAALDDSWRGLSLTMPLKRDILPLLDERDEVVELTGAANTVLVTDEGLRGFNTDVHGIVEALRGAGVTSSPDVQLLGGGATAASVLVAVGRLGAQRVRMLTRSPEKTEPLRDLAARLGIELEVNRLEAGLGAAIDADGTGPGLVVSTLPGDAALDLALDDDLIAGSVLFDVAYDPWPTPLAAVWLAGDSVVVPGLEMLVNQALAQVRIFVGGDPGIPLADEGHVLAAMRASIGLPPASTP